VKHDRLRRELVAVAKRAADLGLNRGTSGNFSVRLPGDDGGFLITPSAVPVDAMRAKDVVEMGPDGEPRGPGRPSTERRLHAAILAARPEVGAVAHAHSSDATAVACLRRDVPPFHYMIAVAGGDSIRVARYETFGTEALARSAVRALDGRTACLLANHGQVAVGATLERALALAVEVEHLCATWLAALTVGQPVLLKRKQMRAAFEAFRTYGVQPPREGSAQAPAEDPATPR
jgi:L-fuculose-phosphate aldolase